MSAIEHARTGTNATGNKTALSVQAPAAMNNHRSNQFAHILDDRGVTAERLAQLAGISGSYAAKLRCGLVPSREVRARIAVILGVHVDDLWSPDAVRDLGEV
jgi:hypothetical protein